MSDSPIVVAGQALPSLSGTTAGPIVVPSVNAAVGNQTVNAAVGASNSVYKVQMVANGKTFNMLLPPSVETKHPGRSNPLQLPGLQIKAGVAISKLKIPGFFPIYQHLGVESLTISMSGMFTAYDGLDILSTAGSWEGWAFEQDVVLKDGQDSYTSACEFYDFAVKNRALIQVTINTSEGSFTPKTSNSTTFRDSKSNINFSGYVKEFEQVYIRQDRNYYMIKFEIIDLGTNVCTPVISSQALTGAATTAGSAGVNSTGSITPALVVANAINPSIGAPTAAATVANSLGTPTSTSINNEILNSYNNLSPANQLTIQDLLIQRGFLDPAKANNVVSIGQAITLANNYYSPTNISDLTNSLIDDKNNSFNTPAGKNVTNVATGTAVTVVASPIPTIEPSPNGNDYNSISSTLGISPAVTKLKTDLIQNNGAITPNQLNSFTTNPYSSSSYRYAGITNLPQKNGPSSPFVTFKTNTGSLLYLVPNNASNTNFTLKQWSNNEFL